MTKIARTISIFIFIALLSYVFKCCNNKIPENLELPKVKNKSTLIKHTAYSLSYNENKEQANWVAYKLLNNNTIKKFKRKNYFKTDKLVKTKTANNSDYKHSGYDRGHLAPAADMSYDKKILKESFLYSNISPQRPGFNRGIWKHLEQKFRDYAKKYNTVYIVTGPIFGDNDTTIGNNSVDVPKAFFKAALVYNDTIKQAIGFIIPNKKSEKPILNYCVTIDSIESIINTDLYYKLPNKIENKIESSINLNYWK